MGGSNGSSTLRRLARGAVTLAAAAWLAGCATAGTISDPPRVTLANLAPLEFQLFEQRYQVTLRVQNPNDQDLRIRGMSYEIELNGKPFGSGVSSEPVTVPAYGETRVALVVTSHLGNVIEQIRQLERLNSGGAVVLKYGIKGSIQTEGTLGKFRFENSDEVELLPARAGSTGGAI